MLGEDIDKKVKLYLTTAQNSGSGVSAHLAMAAAKGLMLALNQGALALHGGHVIITRHWAYSLFHHMKFVQRKVTTSQSKFTANNLAEVKQWFLDAVVETVKMEEVCPELIMNWDQTGIQIIPSSTWTMASEGASRIEMIRTKLFLCSYYTKRRLDTAIQSTNFQQGGTSYMHQNTGQIKQRQDSNAEALVIMDNIKGQVNDAIHTLLEQSWLHCCHQTRQICSNHWILL